MIKRTKEDEQLIARIRAMIAKVHGEKIAQASVIEKNRGGFFYVWIARRKDKSLYIHGLSDLHGRRKAMEKWCREMEDQH
jgi:hypothetical protein